MIINLEARFFPKGLRYEDAYGGYLDVFKRIAETPQSEEVIVESPPWSWVPLLHMLRTRVLTPRVEFEIDYTCARMFAAIDWRNVDRTTYEVCCGFRPECVDGLWKVDNQWNTQRGIEFPYEKDFVLTTNGGFFRQEIKKFIDEDLANYQPKKRNVLLVPCAADKPYPAPMHEAVLQKMPASFYLMNVTGALGLVPQDLWPVMPNYDLGIPNEWRVYTAVKDYFRKFPHRRIVVYLDFYSVQVRDALAFLGYWTEPDRGFVSFVNKVEFYPDYLDLMDPERLAALEKVLRTWPIRES